MTDNQIHSIVVGLAIIILGVIALSEISHGIDNIHLDSIVAVIAALSGVAIGRIITS